MQSKPKKLIFLSDIAKEKTPYKIVKRRFISSNKVIIEHGFKYSNGNLPISNNSQEDK